MLNLLVDPGVAKDDSNSCYKEGTGFGSALLDARNGFNELNRYLMLWNVAHLWNHGSQFAFNSYCHWVCCLVQTEPGGPPLAIHSKEGITQGDCLQKKKFEKVLEQHEMEKKDKYLQNCLEMQKDFTPMVYSLDGIARRKARNAEKRLPPTWPASRIVRIFKWCIM